MSDEIMQVLEKAIVEKSIRQNGRKLSPVEPLISGGLIDSFHLIDLALTIEEIYGVHIDDTELNAETFDTLEQLTALVRSRLNNN
jgi:acyl carrier protein